MVTGGWRNNAAIHPPYFHVVTEEQDSSSSGVSVRPEGASFRVWNQVSTENF